MLGNGGRSWFHRVTMLRLAVVGVVMNWNAFPIEIIAHRGASYDAPENTLPAVRLAWDRGADAVEIDIHQTGDGRIVAIHDTDTFRVTGREGEVAALRFDQLRVLDAGAWKGQEWVGTTIPTLEEVLETVPEHKTLVVEIKCPSTVLPELERVLDASGKRSQVMLIAFDYPTIQQAKRRMPDVRCYWLYGFSDREAERYGVATADRLVELARSAGLDGLDVHHSGSWVPELVRSLHALGKKLYVYTVNSEQAARRLRALGVDGITTDRPAFLRGAIGHD